MVYVKLLAIGLGAGVCSGMFGIGGGLVIVPALMYFLNMTQLGATGTSLMALIPPVGLLAAIEYHRNGYANVRYALLIAAGLFIGALFGAKLMIGLPPVAARRLYALFLLIIGARMLIAGK
ncbi:MAG: sulfite exporter TauE/SafE family protein [Bryobacteraceae bacterium]